MAGDSSEDKPLPPSEKKLRDARKKGQVAKSKDFVTAAVTLAAIGLFAAQASTAAALFTGLIRSAGELMDQPMAVALPILSTRAAVVAAEIVGPLLALLVIAAIMASVAATGGLVFSLDPLIPKPESLNPAAGLKKLVSVRSLVELVKSLVKLVLIVLIAARAMRGALAALVELPSCGLRCSPPLLRSLLTPLVGGSLAVFAAFAIGDLLLQRWLFRRDMRMSLTDQKNEHKNTEGNPLVRSAHKRERREASSMRSGMHEATFAIVGSRVAVGMRYSAVDTRVPMLVTRAEAGQVLAFIRAAKSRDLPIVHDPHLARTLFDKVEIGKRIPRELFQPVIDCMNQIPKEEATKA